MLGSLPPYALAPLAFPFPALASRAGHAPLGGEREVVLALFVCARLAAGAIATPPAPPPVRAARESGARSWLSGLTLPTAMRSPIMRLAAASARDDRPALAAALREAVTVARPWLDGECRRELERLEHAITK